MGKWVKRGWWLGGFRDRSSCKVQSVRIFSTVIVGGAAAIKTCCWLDESYVWKSWCGSTWGPAKLVRWVSGFHHASQLWAALPDRAQGDGSPTRLLLPPFLVQDLGCVVVAASAITCQVSLPLAVARVPQRAFSVTALHDTSSLKCLTFFFKFQLSFSFGCLSSFQWLNYVIFRIPVRESAWRLCNSY